MTLASELLLAVGAHAILARSIGAPAQLAPLVRPFLAAAGMAGAILLLRGRPLGLVMAVAVATYAVLLLALDGEIRGRVRAVLRL
jgi:hypothetical protein